ncbi:hypothetical protein Q7P37_000972 [Cladosporium fusiforme]
MYAMLTADDWMGIICALVFLACCYIRFLKPGLPRYAIHTLLARYYSLVALLTGTRGFIFAVFIYNLLQNTLHRLLRFIAMPFAWVPSMHKPTSPANVASLALSPANSVLIDWMEEDVEEAWKKRMEAVSSKEESDAVEDSLDFLLLPADDGHANSTRKLLTSPRHSYLVTV